MHDNPRHPELTAKQANSHDHALPSLFSSLWRSNLITSNHLMTLNKDGSLRMLFFLQPLEQLRNHDRADDLQVLSRIELLKEISPSCQSTF